MDVHIDYIVGILVGIGVTINQMTKRMRIKKDLDKNCILEILFLPEAMMMIRQNIVDKQ